MRRDVAARALIRRSEAGEGQWEQGRQKSCGSPGNLLERPAFRVHTRHCHRTHRMTHRQLRPHLARSTSSPSPPPFTPRSGRASTIAVRRHQTRRTDAPAFYVPEYTQTRRLSIIPVPVYYPEMAGARRDRVSLAARHPGPGGRRAALPPPGDIPPHLDDILAVKPKLVWMQLGIRHDGVAETLARAGIDVVQDHCMLVELRKMGR